MDSENKELEVITGDDSELEISNVYDHLNSFKPKGNDEKQNIIIPKIENNPEKDNKEEESNE